MREVLTWFDVAESPALVERIGTELPEDLHGATDTEMLSAFERALPIEWEEDLQQVGAEQTAAFRQAVLGILAVRTPEPLPKQVSEMVIAELERATQLDCEAELLERARQSIEVLFIDQLWRSKDRAAHERLASDIFFGLKRTARLMFARLE